jgi:hypothetical protein
MRQVVCALQQPAGVDPLADFDAWELGASTFTIE